jgi:hypothetical protein
MKKIVFLFLLVHAYFFPFAQGEEYNWDTITFESSYQYIQIDTSEQNIWEIGTPDKIYFDTAFSVPKAIVTDTTNSYPVNNNSYFDLFIGEYNIPWFQDDLFIEINHKYDTDTLEDGGFVSVSYDKGETFMNIIHDNTGNFSVSPYDEWGSTENLYTLSDTLFNDEPGFSGNSQGWITTKFSWFNFVVKNNLMIEDTIIIRFNFISNGIDNFKEGWMIDNIRLYSVDLGDGIENIETDIIKIYPNPLENEAQIIVNEPYNEILLEVTDISSQVVNRQVFKQTKNIRFFTGDLKNGVYFIRLTSHDTIIGIKKVLILK